MFGLFKKKSKEEKLQEQHQKLMKEAYELSKTNRTESDKKYAEAEEVITQLESLKRGDNTV
ncbi:MAG: Lacal_2735 family protein [Candidatus Cyclobacteriaceae bacterium M2_1C_046]